MKKISFVLLLCAITSAMHAQLKVNGTQYSGSVNIGHGGLPSVFMGSQPDNPTGENWGKWGFEVWGEDFNFFKPWPSPFGQNRNYYLYLNVAGGVGIGKAPTNVGICLDVKGNVYANNVQLTSDERLKTNVRLLTATDRVSGLYKLSGKSYQKYPIEEQFQSPEQKLSKSPLEELKKNDSESRRVKSNSRSTEFGFLAQELKEVYPELVSQDTLGYYYVNYIGLIPVLVEALKEQKIQIDNLATQLKASLSPAKSVAPMPDSKSDILTSSLPATLYQNTPNPFSQSAQIKYYLPKEVNTALLCIYDINGKQLRQITLNERGESSLTLHGSELAAGIYLYGLIADGQQIDVKRMVLTE